MHCGSRSLYKQTLRDAAEGVIVGLMEAPADVRRAYFPLKGTFYGSNVHSIQLSAADLVKPPRLTPVLVNKCLIALVAAKVVKKVTTSVRPSCSLPMRIPFSPQPHISLGSRSLFTF